MRYSKHHERHWTHEQFSELLTLETFIPVILNKQYINVERQEVFNVTWDHTGVWMNEVFNIQCAQFKHKETGIVYEGFEYALGFISGFIADESDRNDSIFELSEVEFLI